jgi:hypothetical protein
MSAFRLGWIRWRNSGDMGFVEVNVCHGAFPSFHLGCAGLTIEFGRAMKIAHTILGSRRR